ncbi:MAG: hypothetical protein DI629_20965 [Mesorhizobium amorphae]|nr:MAG: hypothetical protein DI629_20965 [Mesorhizobium amorphae]
MIILAAIVATVVAAPPEPSCGEALVVSARDGRVTSVMTEIADSPDEIDRGLTGRAAPPPGAGMLFVMPDEPVAFWMRGVPEPLDIMFADRRGVIRRVVASAPPLDDSLIPGADAGDPDPNRPFALEMRAGEADRLDLRPGDVIHHPAVTGASCAAPGKEREP